VITLKDSVEIKTTPEELFDWFKNLDKHFEEWHPNHKKFVKVTGGTDEGDIVYFEELVEGKWYKVKVKIGKLEKSEQGWRIELLTSSRLAKILFIAEAKEDGCIFTHIESFGFKTPVIGRLIDFLMSKVFYSLFRFDLIRKDMEEDGLNLKRILERG
jgi:hypothetical protein